MLTPVIVGDSQIFLKNLLAVFPLFDVLLPYLLTYSMEQSHS